MSHRPSEPERIEVDCAVPLHLATVWSPPLPLLGMTLELDFHEEMVELYLRAKREINYPARYFIGMVSSEGGRATARYLLDTKEPSGGYVVLWENGRLDLSVEAEVLRP